MIRVESDLVDAYKGRWRFYWTNFFVYYRAIADNNIGEVIVTKLLFVVPSRYYRPLESIKQKLSVDLQKPSKASTRSFPHQSDSSTEVNKPFLWKR